MTPAETQPVQPSVTGTLIVMLVVEVLALIPWAIFSALSFMGFDSGFHIWVVIMMLPLWIYPVLMLFCTPVAFSLNRKGRTESATKVMFAPLLISGGWMVFLIGVVPSIYQSFH